MCGLQERALKACLRMTRNMGKEYIITLLLGKFIGRFGKMDTWLVKIC